jgi:hypothetical protein
VQSIRHGTKRKKWFNLKLAVDSPDLPKENRETPESADFGDRGTQQVHEAIRKPTAASNSHRRKRIQGLQRGYRRRIKRYVTVCRLRQPARLYEILAMIGAAGIGIKALLRARKLLIPRTRKN